MSAVTQTKPGSALERYRAAFDARWNGSDDALVVLRRAALERFLAAGFPSQQHEDWKYTSLRRLESRSFALAGRNTLALEVNTASWIASAGMRTVLVNGHAMPSLSSAAQPPGVTLLSLGQWLERDPAAVAELLSRSRSEQSGALGDLNLAFFEDGLVLDLAEGATTDQPVYLVHQWNEAAAGSMSHPRVIVRAGRNARCVLIEHFLGPQQAEYFANPLTSVELADGATLQHYRLQQESTKAFHLGAIDARLGRDASYSMHDIALGAGLGRLDVRVTLAQPGARVTLNGLIAPNATQHLDAHTRVDHAAPHTMSDESYRGIASGRGRGVFNGKVIVRPGAQKTDARQSSRNLLLSAGAEIDTKPELEIYADDVKCSHGATTGKLDAAALFYLRSRGVAERDARAMLIRAFAESILSSIEEASLRTYPERLLDERYAID